MPEIIDAHHHLWKYTPEDYPWITPHTPEMQPLRQDFLPADLMQVMDSAGVSGSVVVQARQTLAETRWLLELAEREQRFLAGLQVALPDGEVTCFGLFPFDGEIGL